MDSCLFKRIKREVKRKQPREGFDLGSLIPIIFTLSVAQMYINI